MTKTSPRRRRQRGFSLFDLIVVIIVIAAMFAIQIPTDAASRRTAQRMQNSTQVRGIHQGLVTFANSNRNNFAGLNSKGQILADSERNTGNSGKGSTVQARYWIMLRGDFFSPRYAISPSETGGITEYDGDHDWRNDELPPPVKWDQRTKHYSYAMLGFRANEQEAFGQGDRQAYGVQEGDAARLAEWKQTLNSQAVVLSDRNTGDNATDRVRSIHTGEHGEWSGSVLWNDNHVGFEAEQYFETKFANGQLNRAVLDNLFDDKQAENQVKGANALQVIADEDIVHGGE